MPFCFHGPTSLGLNAGQVNLKKMEEIFLKMGQGEEKLSKKNTVHNEKEILLIVRITATKRNGKNIFFPLFVSSRIQTKSELEISKSL
jgi:hypothetical protein